MNNITSQLRNYTRQNRSRIVVALVGLLVSTIVIIIIVHSIDISATASLLTQVSFWNLLLLVLLYLISFIFRTCRWRLIIRPIYSFPKFSHSLMSIIIGYAANNVLPVRGGEFVRMVYFSRLTGISKTFTISSIISERILDGLALLCILVISSVLSETNPFNEQWFDVLLLTSTIVFLSALLFLVMVRIWGHKLSSYIESRYSSKAMKLFNHLLINISNSVQFMGFSINTLSIVTLSLVIWCIEGLMYVAAIKIVGLSFNIFAGYLILSIVNFGILIPSAPAYVGVFQGMTILGMRLFNVSEEIALSVGILVHICQFVPVTLSGAFIFLSEMFRKNGRLNDGI